MWILGGGYVGPGGTTLSPLRYDLDAQPRLRARIFHNDVWSSLDGRSWKCHLAEAPWAARSYHDTAGISCALTCPAAHPSKRRSMCPTMPTLLILL
jgi:hypothetical protein